MDVTIGNFIKKLNYKLGIVKIYSYICINTKTNTMNKDEVIQLWLDAEEELRNGNEGKCLELKDKFSNEWAKLSLDDKQEVTNELENLAA